MIYFLNIMLTWKIVRASEVSVLYIYIYIYIDYGVWTYYGVYKNTAIAI